MHYYKITCSNDTGVVIYYMSTTREITKNFVSSTLNNILNTNVFDIDSIELISKEKYIEKLSKEGLPED